MPLPLAGEEERRLDGIGYIPDKEGAIPAGTAVYTNNDGSWLGLRPTEEELTKMLTGLQSAQ